MGIYDRERAMKDHIRTVAIAFAPLMAIIIVAVMPLYADAGVNNLEAIIARFEKMRHETSREIRKSDKTIAKAQKIIALAQDKANREAESIARQALSKAEGARGKNEKTLRAIERELATLYPLRGKDTEIEKARKRIARLRDDVKEIQFALQLYRDGLLRNASGLESERRKISKMSDKILVDGVEYMKGGAFSGLLKTNFKYLNKAKYEKYENIIDHVEHLQTEKDIIAWMDSKSGEMGNLIEGADLLASTVIPGWDHIKMNFKAWSTVARECSSWRRINRLNRETGKYARAVEDLAMRMKSKVREIDCLKQCMDSSIVGCVERCSKPSPPN